jgi:hypothetical protein
MYDPSSIILGLPGLVTACADLYKLSVAARHRSHDMDVIVCRIEVEQMKFSCWLEDVGFVEGSQPMLKLPPAGQVLMANLLKRIEGKKLL